VCVLRLEGAIGKNRGMNKYPNVACTGEGGEGGGGSCEFDRRRVSMVVDEHTFENGRMQGLHLWIPRKN
jgi:hypothetical protein